MRATATSPLRTRLGVPGQVPAILGSEVAKKLACVDTPQGAYIIRARPSDAVEKVYPANGAPMLALIEVVRDAVWRRPWTVVVRRVQDDPHGPVLIETSVPSRRHAVDAMKRYQRELRDE